MNYFLLWLVLFVIVNGLFSWIVGYIASQKGRSFGAFFALSFFLSFLVGILAVIAIPRREIPAGVSTSSRFVKTSDGEKAKCPYCSEWVKSEASVCKHCGKEIAEELAVLRKNIAEELRIKQLNEQSEIEHKAAAARASKESRKLRNQQFLRSKNGKIVLISAGFVAVLAIVISSIQLGTSFIAQQEAQAELDSKQALLDSDCAEIYKNLKEFNSLTESSELSDGMHYGDHALLAQNSSRRALIQEEAAGIIPKLIATDERFAGEYGELSFPRGVKVASAVLYNQVVEGTSFEQIQGGEITEMNQIPEDSYSLYEDCDNKTFDEMQKAEGHVKSWGEATLVIRQCKLVGKLWDVTCN